MVYWSLRQIPNRYQLNILQQHYHSNVLNLFCAFFFKFILLDPLMTHNSKRIGRIKRINELVVKVVCQDLEMGLNQHLKIVSLKSKVSFLHRYRKSSFIPFRSVFVCLDSNAPNILSFYFPTVYFA